MGIDMENNGQPTWKYALYLIVLIGFVAYLAVVNGWIG